MRGTRLEVGLHVLLLLLHLLLLLLHALLPLLVLLLLLLAGWWSPLAASPQCPIPSWLRCVGGHVP